MKNYILSDGRSISVPLDKEEEFLKQLEKQGLTATLESDELGKSQGAGQPQNNQLKVNENLKVDLNTGEIIKDTESKLGDGSLELPKNKLEISKNKVDSLNNVLQNFNYEAKLEQIEKQINKIANTNYQSEDATTQNFNINNANKEIERLTDVYNNLYVDYKDRYNEYDTARKDYNKLIDQSKKEEVKKQEAKKPKINLSKIALGFASGGPAGAITAAAAPYVKNKALRAGEGAVSMVNNFLKGYETGEVAWLDPIIDGAFPSIKKIKLGAKLLESKGIDVPDYLGPIALDDARERRERYESFMLEARDKGIPLEQAQKLDPTNRIKLEGVLDWFDKHTYRHVDKNGDPLDYMQLFEKAKSPKDYLEATDAFVDDVFGAIPSLIVSRIPYGIGPAFMGTGMYMDNFEREIYKRGINDETTRNQIVKDSWISGTADFTTELIGGRILNKIISSGIAKEKAKELLTQLPKVVAKKLGLAGMSEFLTEGAAGWLDLKSDEWSYGEKYTTKEKLRAFIRDGAIGLVLGTGAASTSTPTKKDVYEYISPQTYKQDQLKIEQDILDLTRDADNATGKSKDILNKQIKELENKKKQNKQNLFDFFENLTDKEKQIYANNLDIQGEQLDILFDERHSKKTREEAVKKYDGAIDANSNFFDGTDINYDPLAEKFIGTTLRASETIRKNKKFFGFNKSNLDIEYVESDKRLKELTEKLPGFQESDGLFFQQEDGKNKIYINTKVAAMTGQTNVLGHEYLHAIVSNAFSEGIGANNLKSAVTSFKEYLIKTGNEDLVNRIERRLARQYDGRDANGNIMRDDHGLVKTEKLKDQEEYFNIFSDIIRKEKIEAVEAKSAGIKNSFRALKRGFGFGEVDFQSGQEVFDFLVDYNTNMRRASLLGTLTSKGIAKVSLKGLEAQIDEQGKSDVIKDDKVKASKTPLQAINDLVPSNIKTQEDYYKLLDDTKVANRIFDGRKLAPVIERYIRTKSTSPEIAEKNIQVVIDRLVNFNPEAKRKDGSIVGPEGFGEFIFANARFGKLVSAKKLFEEGQIRGKTDRIDQQQEGQRKRDIVEDDLSPEEIMIAKQEAEAAKEKLDEISKETLEDKLGLDEKADKEFEKALVTAFGTKLPEIDSKKLRTELRKIVADKLRLKIQKIFGTEKGYDNFIQNDLPSLLGFIKVDDLIQMEREVGGKRFPNGRKILATRKRITSVIEVRKLQEQGLIDKRIKPESGPSLKRRLDPTPKELLAFFRGTEAEKTLGYKPPGSTETGMLGTRKDRLAELLTGEIAFNKAIQVAQQQIEKIQFIQEQQNRNIKENIIAELGVTIGRDPSTTIKFSKSEILEQTDLLDNLISDIGFENVIKDGKLIDGFPEMSNLAIQTIGRLYDKNVTLDEEAKAFKQRMFKSTILPELLIKQYKNVGNLKFNTDMLDLLHEDATTMALELGPEIMNSIGYEILGYKNRIMDPAKEKRDGSKGEFYDRLINLRDKVNNKQVKLPSGLNLKDVRVMNISVSSGLFSKINKILALKSKKEKLKRLKELQPEIDKANVANIKLAKHIAKTIITLARSGKISPISALNMLQSQTSIVKGFRGLTRLDLIDVREGSQTASESHPQYKKALKYYKDSRYDVLERLGFKGEHLKPNSNTMGDIAELIFKEDADIDFELDLILAKHSQLLTSKFTADNIDDGPGGKTSTADFNRIKFLKQPDINSMVSANGRSYQDVLGDVEIRLMELKFVNEIKQKSKNPIILRKAHNTIIKYSKSGKSRGMSTFDFDDTLARTKSGVRYTMPNPEGTPAPRRKVIFLAGGAGSGKSNVVKQLGLEKQGFKIVNQDISLEWLAKNSGLPTNMRDFTPEQASKWGSLQWEARHIAQKKQMKFKGRGDGIIVDGTGANKISMSTQVMKFKNAGYDVQMIFVETSLDVALDRNRARKERSLKDFIVERNWKEVQANKKAFKEEFGGNFAEVNTDNLKQGDTMPTGLVNKINNFVSGYIKGRLTAEEFASQGDALLSQGAEFDFSEFNQVVDGTPGPLLEKARKRAEKYGTKDMFVLTARPQQSAFAIQQFLKGQGLDIPIGNITGLANSTGEAKANWMLEKFAEGYNDMYFVDDALQNVKAVKDVLDQLDIKSEVVQAKIKFSKSAPLEFNKILEQTKKVAAGKVFSAAEARKIGVGKGKNIFKNFFVPPSAEDFKGLLYAFIGKGEQGNAHAAFFKENLLDPFAKGIRDWNTYKQAMSNDYKALKKQFKGVGKRLNKKVKGTPFTNDNAIRVYLWNKAGFEIPGLSDSQIEKLVDHIENDSELKQFAEGLGIISRTPEGYIEPNEFWAVESIASDLTNVVRDKGRKDFLAEWINNKNIIFSPDNLNKIEAIYGTGFRSELEKILYRMETGRNRLTGKDAQVNMLLDWINGSVGAVMFFNMRSATLQTISMANFINMSDNNPVAAAAALANAPQFIKDFVYIFNSDMLKQRRAGLQIDVSASELTRAFKDGKSKPQAIIHWLLEKGFTPTQIADSFAIAAGGAPFYRNRLKSYLKQGMSEAKAKEQAWLDFQEVAEETQQSSRPDLISNQQAGPLGRLILAWQNTPMQMTRLMKKKLSDFVNRRRIPGYTQFQSDMANISGIAYYGLIQNIYFGALQTGLMFMLFGWDEDEERKEKLEKRVANGALDSILRGTGIYGAGVSTLKNVLLKWKEEADKPGWKRENMNIAQEAVNLSPPLGTKMRKIMQAIRTEEWNKGVSKEIGWRIENPNLSIAANWVEALTNLPIARMIDKANNIEEALTGNHQIWQKVALISGWSKWSLGVEDEELEKAKIEAKEQRAIDKKTEKEEKKKQEEIENKKKGIKTVRCSGTNSSGKRCSLTTQTKAKTWKCMHHAAFKDGMDRDGDGKKEYRCKAIKSNGKRCNNKTENKNKKCYAHQ